MANNKVVFGNEILMDLTEDTVTEDKVLEGETFHDRSGVLRSGSLVIPVQDVEVNGESVVNSEGIAEVVVPVSGDVSTTDSFESYTGGKVKSVQMELSPIQDLHGYDSPWVGGAGKNKLPLVLADIKANNVTGTWNGNVYTKDGIDFTILTDDADNVLGISANGTAEHQVGITLVSSKPISAGSYILNGTASGSGWSTSWLNVRVDTTNYNDIGSGVSFTASETSTMTAYCYIASGATISNKTFYPMIRLATETDPTFEPYENKCPISAHTQAKLEQRGKNRFNPSNVLNAFFFNGYNITSEQNTRTIYAPCKPNTTYTVSKTAGQRFCVGYTKELPANGVVVYDKTSDNTASSITITTGADAKYIVGYVYHAQHDTITADEMLASCQIELGSSATDYEPYQEKTYTINLGGTYYWLRGDVVSGKWYVVGQSVDLGTYSFGTSSNGWFQSTSGLTLAKAVANSEVANLTCDIFTKQSANVVYARNTNNTIALNESKIIQGYTTAFAGKTGAEIKTALTGVMLCYELATPIPINLDPKQIEAFLGENNFSAPLDQQEIIEIIARNIAEFNEVIDDENISDGFTYSSEKIEDRLDEYVDKDAVEEKSATDEFSTINGGLLSSLKVSLSPNQDLHGYDNPWVGGAGKNKCDNSTNIGGYYDASGNYSASDDYRTSALIEVSANTDYTASLFDTSDNSRVAGLVYTEWDASQNFIRQVANVPTITTGATTKYLRLRNYNAQTALVKSNHYAYQLEQGSSATSYAPYSNICPISGHTQVKVGDDGKNLFNPTALTTTTNGVTFTNNGDGTYTLNGTATADIDFPIESFQIPAIGVQYRMVGCPTGLSSNAFLQIRGTEWMDDGNGITKTSVDTYTHPVQIRVKNGATFNNVVFKPMFSLDTTITYADYVPYNGYQVTVNLGGTYYSGTLDVVTGVLTINKVKAVTPTRGSLDSSGKLYSISFSGGTIHNYTDTLTATPYVMCSHLDVASLADARDTQRKCICQYAGTVYIGGYVGEETALDNMLALADFSIVFELANPTPIQLSPTMVKALVGENHLSAPLDGQEITESKYRELFTWDEVEEIAQSIADSKIDDRNTSYETTFSSHIIENRYAKKIWDVPVLTPYYQVSSGATEVTFTNQFIFSDYQTSCELIQIGGGPRVGISDVVISMGSVKFTFDAPLTTLTRFVCSIMNFY